MSDGPSRCCSAPVAAFLREGDTRLLARFPSPPQFILQPLATLADPYLNAFRGLLPAVVRLLCSGGCQAPSYSAACLLQGGLDLSPILAFTVLNVVQSGAAALPAELSAARKLRVPKLVKADSPM